MSERSRFSQAVAGRAREDSPQSGGDGGAVGNLAVGNLIDARRMHGDAGLDGGRRGRRPGEQQLLDVKFGDRTRRKIADKCSDQLKLPFALWTREAVRDLILKEASVSLSLQAVSNYLARWNMTPQQPAKRAKEQSVADVKQWLERD